MLSNVGNTVSHEGPGIPAEYYFDSKATVMEEKLIFLLQCFFSLFKGEYFLAVAT